MAKLSNKTAVALLKELVRTKKLLEKIEQELKGKENINLCETCFQKNNCHVKGSNTTQCSGYRKDKQHERI